MQKKKKTILGLQRELVKKLGPVFEVFITCFQYIHPLGFSTNSTAFLHFLKENFHFFSS